MAAAVLAHPLTDVGQLEIPPLAAAAVAMVIVAAVARFWPAGGGESEDDPATEDHSWEGALGPARTAVRLVAVVLLVLAVVVGRVGPDDQLTNLTPALVLGAGWPLLIAASLLLGTLWRWVDPWDAVARVLDRDPGPDPDRDVRWAVVPAAAFVWYVGAYRFPESLSPRLVSLVLAVYTIAMVAGALVVGRRRWLSRTDVFGSFLTWVGIFRRGRGTRWAPPVGAEVVLGVLAGGLVFGAIRLSRLWGGLTVAPLAPLYATIGIAAVAGGFGTALWVLERRARATGAGGSVPAVVVPAVAALAISLAMYAEILFTSLALLPALLVTTFGGPDPEASFMGLCEGITCAPLIGVQTAVLLAGGIAGAVLLARRVPSPAGRQPAMAALCLVVGGGVVALTAS